MKKVILFIFFIFSFNSYSQNKNKMSYYFDTSIVTNYKNYPNHFNGKMIHFYNSKDTTYSLYIKINDTVKKANLDDYNKNRIIHFDVNFNYNKCEDLNKLTNSILYSNVNFGRHKKYKKYIEVFEHEKDTINNQILVHLTQFKNNKKKEILMNITIIFQIKRILLILIRTT